MDKEMIRMMRSLRQSSWAIPLGLATALSFTTGCTPKETLTVPTKPFDPTIIHAPQVPAAGENVIFLSAGPSIEFDAQNAVLHAKPGTTIVFPEGRHTFSDELIVNTSHITLAGMGLDKTILDFSSQETGAQGILGLGNEFTVQDLAVLDPAGDGIRAEGVQGVYFKRLHVEWTNGPDKDNGAYGLYPVDSDNVLVEDSIVRGASDAGVYVGQSANIIVRRNTVELSVAGIEIENSTGADVYHNWSAFNTGGLLVFNLPDLGRIGQSARVYDNVIYKNDTRNFGPDGSVLSIVPSGTGVLVMANDEVEVFDNLIVDHGTDPISVISYFLVERPWNDDRHDMFPEAIYIYDNEIHNRSERYLDGSQMNLLVNALFGSKGPSDIVYDGIGGVDATGNPIAAALAFDDSQRLCLHGNVDEKGQPASFGNMNLQNPGALFPGGPVSYDKAPHDCVHPKLEPIVLMAPLPVPPTGEDPATTALCDLDSAGVNWAAFEANCPNLSDYNLFADNSNPLSEPNGGGMPYDLSVALFSDYAYKSRVVYVPEGSSIAYSANEFNYPVGTIITKTFYYPSNFADPGSANKLMETRLLIHRASGWERLPYIWQDGVATLALGGGVKHVTWLDESGSERATDYVVPNINQCSSCHGPRQTDRPLGPKARRLNSDKDYGSGSVNQLSHWASSGILSGLPALNAVPAHPAMDDTSAPLADRARAYLEINCAHCHGENGRAQSTGLLLEAANAFDVNAGLCKVPIAAGPAAGGRLYDIEPGDADNSIMIFRLNSVEAAIKMPELGKSMVHEEGLALISEWINSLPGSCATN
jgi:parallel beta-helix repeat protein